MITSLDLSDCTALRELNISCCHFMLRDLTLPVGAPLEKLDISYDSYLPEIDFSLLPGLKELNCECWYHELDLSLLPDLEKLNCGYNGLEELDFTYCPKLEYLNCSGNYLKAIDLSDCPALSFDTITAQGDGTVSFSNWSYDFDACEMIPHEDCAYASCEGFVGWYSECGELISNDLSLRSSDTEYTRVIALFEGGEIIPGDADGNGAVDTTDALIVLRCALGISGSEEDILASSDMDGNGLIDTTDALIILRLALGIGA